MRSPAWMVAYALGLTLLGGAYAALVFIGSEAALLLALVAFAVMIVAVILTLSK